MLLKRLADTKSKEKFMDEFSKEFQTDTGVRKGDTDAH